MQRDVFPQALFALLHPINVGTVYDRGVAVSTPDTRWQRVLEVRDGAAT